MLYFLNIFFFQGKTTNKKSKSLTETASYGKVGCLCPIPSKSTEPGKIKSWYVNKEKWFIESYD